MSRKQEQKRTWGIWVGLFLFSCVVITIVSKSSFLYYINDGAEVNTLYTMAEGWKNGQIPYKDLVDYRGPMMVLLYLFASFVGPETSYLGVYILEILALFFTLFLFYKFSNQYFSSHKSLWITFLFASLLVMSPYYGKGGNVEELMMPFLFFPILLIALFSKKEKEGVPNYFQLGLLSGGAMGILFWSRYTLLGGWIGFLLCLTLFSIFQKQGKRLLNYLGGCLLSFGLLAFLWFGYFMWTDALEALKSHYFLFYRPIYGENGVGWFHFLGQSVTTLAKLFTQNSLLHLFFLVGLFMVLNSKQIFGSVSSKCLYLTSFLFLGMGLGLGVKENNGLYLALLPYGGVLLVCLCGKYLSVPQKNSDWMIKTGMVIGLSLLIILGMNQTITESKLYPGNRTIFIAQKGEQSTEMLPMQELFATEIKKEKKSSLLMYGLSDIGVYKKAGILPQTKYFMRPSIPFSEHQEIMDAQNQVLKNREATFVVMQRSGTKVDPNKLPKLLLNNYDLIGTKSQYDRQVMTYLLFKVKEPTN